MRMFLTLIVFVPLTVSVNGAADFSMAANVTRHVLDREARALDLKQNDIWDELGEAEDARDEEMDALEEFVDAEGADAPKRRKDRDEKPEDAPDAPKPEKRVT